jgi:hypothetical protein
LIHRHGAWHRVGAGDVHRGAWERGGVAGGGAGAAGRPRAAGRRALARRSGRCATSGLVRGVPAGAGSVGLDHRPQCADRHPLGHGQCCRNSEAGGRIGRAGAGRDYGSRHLDREC